VHYCRNSRFGPFWSVTKYRDIMQVEKDHATFSSEMGGIGIVDQKSSDSGTSFISMDPPKHGQQRMTVAPVVAPRSLAQLESIIRERAGRILDELPIGETFNWVERVSIELTTQMLATIFDFPFERRHKLTYWSDLATNSFSYEPEFVQQQLGECLKEFTELWHDKVARAPSNDLISMLAHGEATKAMEPREFLGNLLLLIIGGNDTTRNSISGGVLALNENPAEYAKLRANPKLIDSMVPEIIRWQTPLAHMRRTATKDARIGDQNIAKGDKVVMWYISGNRDSEVIERADEFIIDRLRPRTHVSFGFGIHRCMGNRLAEMQLRVLWEEIMARFEIIEVVGQAVRTKSSFVRGFTELPVRVR
jgi:cytochrome P450